MNDWSIVVPVRGGAGKSRLVVPGVDRAELARSIGIDTIVAARECRAVARVIVVTSDTLIAAALPEHCEVVTDPGTGLNGAVTAGLAATDPARPRAAMLGDLPALRSDHLSMVLDAARGEDAGALADAEGTGTTLITRTAAGTLSPAFGAGSFARHLAAGFSDLAPALVTDGRPGAWTARRDVDTIEQLRAAARLGLGIRTAALWQVATAGQGAASSVA